MTLVYPPSQASHCTVTEARPSSQGSAAEARPGPSCTSQDASGDIFSLTRAMSAENTRPALFSEMVHQSQIITKRK